MGQILAAGTQAPDFTLRVAPDQPLSLRDLKGKPVILAFYRDGDGVCERALFVIDRDGGIFWSYCSPIAVNPGADGILKALERM